MLVACAGPTSCSHVLAGPAVPRHRRPFGRGQISLSPPGNLFPAGDHNRRELRDHASLTPARDRNCGLPGRCAAHTPSDRTSRLVEKHRLCRLRRSSTGVFNRLQFQAVHARRCGSPRRRRRLEQLLRVRRAVAAKVGARWCGHEAKRSCGPVNVPGAMTVMTVRESTGLGEPGRPAGRRPTELSVISVYPVPRLSRPEDGSGWSNDRDPTPDPAAECWRRGAASWPRLVMTLVVMRSCLPAVSDRP